MAALPPSGFEVLERRQLQSKQETRAFELVSSVDPSIRPDTTGDLLALVHAKTGRVLSVFFFNKRELCVAKTDKSDAMRPILKHAIDELGHPPGRELLLHVRDYVAVRHDPVYHWKSVDTNVEGDALMRHAASHGALARIYSEKIQVANLSPMIGHPTAKPTWKEYR